MLLRGIDFKKGRTSKGYNGSRDPFYQSKEWRTFRNTYIAQHPLCVLCTADGKTEVARVVDHKTPLKKGGQMWDHSNLQGLCFRHNAIKTALDNENNF